MDQRIQAAPENAMRAVLLTLCEHGDTKKRIREQLRAVEHMKKLQGDGAKKRKRRSSDSQDDLDDTLNDIRSLDSETKSLPSSKLTVQDMSKDLDRPHPNEQLTCERCKKHFSESTNHEAACNYHYGRLEAISTSMSAT